MQQHASLWRDDQYITLVIFGVTGDLAQKKLIPALWDLTQSGVLPLERLRVFGLSRLKYTGGDFQVFVRDVVEQKRKGVSRGKCEMFAKHFFYEAGLFEDSRSYTRLIERIRGYDAETGQCSAKLMYLAVPPIFYETIFEHIHESGILRTCVSKDIGLGRILVEKPFGRDTKTARSLDEKLGSLFEESQIYRIDHYLAKETLQNILHFRFANHIFEPLWSKEHIESVSIRLAEEFGVEGRGEFYDGIGALRDVGQNHILQMLALVTMESPKSFTDSAIRLERLNVLKSLSPACLVNKNTAKKKCPQVIRGQYRGYKEERGVARDSETETYFHIEASINNPRWMGIPFYLESGKCLHETKTTITVRFRSTHASLCPIESVDGCGNVLTFHVKPEEGISICFWAKRPGFVRELKPHTLHFNYNEERIPVRIPDAYEHVLVEAIRGDQTLFTSTEEVSAQWAFITPILEKWDTSELIEYEKGVEKVG